jgi:hypothetical protein
MTRSGPRAVVESRPVPPLIHVDPELFPPTPTTCLRCNTVVSLQFAGVCDACAQELHEKFRREAREVDAEYVPKMNVTPNAVALKD